MPLKNVHYQCKTIGTKAVFTDENGPQDAILLVGDKKFYVIKQYLANWSKHFNNLFFADSSEKDKKEFKIEGVDAKEFTELLCIIHLCLMTNIRDYNVIFLLKLAAHFEMPSVVSMCGTYLSNFGNAPDVSLMLRLELADQHKMSHLQVAVLKTIEGIDVVERQKFFDKYLNRIKNLSNDTLKHLTRF